MYTNNTNQTNNTNNTKIESHFWPPIKEINDILINHCKRHNYKNNLEIGPGKIPFELATKTIGYNETSSDYISLDIDIEKLPFEDQSIDFTYSRHTLEDIQNPDFALKEIIRVSKSGFIETPSPLIEATKGVDGGEHCSHYCGYMHHRYIVWGDMDKCEIYFLPKYSCILDSLTLNVPNNFYKNGYYWNNYFMWKDKTPKIIMYKNGINIGVKSYLIDEYVSILKDAIATSIKNTDKFLEKYQN